MVIDLVCWPGDLRDIWNDGCYASIVARMFMPLCRTSYHMGVIELDALWSAR